MRQLFGPIEFVLSSGSCLENACSSRRVLGTWQASCSWQSVGRLVLACGLLLSSGIWASVEASKPGSLAEQVQPTQQVQIVWAQIERQEEPQERSSDQQVIQSEAASPQQTDAAKKKEEDARLRREKKRAAELDDLRRTLQAKGVGYSTEDIREFLQNVIAGDQDVEQVVQLVERLNSPVYAERVRAQEQLLMLPSPPTQMLQSIVTKGTQEQAFRAKVVLKFAEPRRLKTIVDVLRVIELAEIDGLVKEILQVVDREADLVLLRQATLAVGSTALPSELDLLVEWLDQFGSAPKQVVAMTGICKLATVENLDLLYELANRKQLAESGKIQAVFGDG